MLAVSTPNRIHPSRVKNQLPLPRQAKILHQCLLTAVILTFASCALNGNQQPHNVCPSFNQKNFSFFFLRNISSMPISIFAAVEFALSH